MQKDNSPFIIHNSQSVHAESTADFIHKMAIAQKESNESGYWLELLYQADYLTQEEYTSIIKDNEELNKILASIIITSKEKDAKR